MLKRWFVEPRPNIFVGTVNRRTREKVIEYVRRNAPRLGLLVIASDQSSQGFSVRTYGEMPRREVRRTGLYLIAEKWDSEEGESETESG